MIEGGLFNAFLNQTTTLTILALALIGGLLISRKERSLRVWVSSQVNREVVAAEAWAENYTEKLVENSKEEFKGWVKSEVSEMQTEMVANLNQWSENSILSLRTWLMGNLEAIGGELIEKPIEKVMKSSLMSNLGKMSGAVRTADSIANGIAEDAMPEKMKFLKDQLISRFPSLKKHLKNPGQIIELAKSFGINVDEIMASATDGKTSNSGGSRW